MGGVILRFCNRRLKELFSVFLIRNAFEKGNGVTLSANSSVFFENYF